MGVHVGCMPIQRGLLRETLAERSLDRSDLLEFSDRANVCVRAITLHHPCTTTLKPIGNVLKFALRAGRYRLLSVAMLKLLYYNETCPALSLWAGIARLISRCMFGAIASK